MHRCVARAISYGLTKLDMSGELDLLIDSHFPEVPCARATASTANDAAAASADSSRRRLGSEDSPTHDRAPNIHDQVPHVPSSSRRRLKTGSSGPGDAAGEGGGIGVPQMGIIDFAGLFLAWLLVTLTIIAHTYRPAWADRWLTKCGNKCKKCQKTIMKADADIGPAVAPEDKTEEIFAEIDIDNTGALLREVLKQLAELKTDAKKREEAPSARDDAGVKLEHGLELRA